MSIQNDGSADQTEIAGTTPEPPSNQTVATGGAVGQDLHGTSPDEPTAEDTISTERSDERAVQAPVVSPEAKDTEAADLQKALAELEELGAWQKQLSDSIGAIEDKATSLAQLQQRVTELEKLSGFLETTLLHDLTPKIDALDAKQSQFSQSTQERLEKIASDTKALTVTSQRVTHDLTTGRVADVESLLFGLIDCLSSTRTYRKSIPVIPSARARQLLPHGHQMLISLILDDMINDADFFSGPRDILEIGTIREVIWCQSSTLRLACLARYLNSTLTSVDMDPENGKRALSYIDKGYQAHLVTIAEKGEDYLKSDSTTVPRYVYLDAYDFDHGGHSPARQEAYKKNLGAEISDAQCAQMHLDCVIQLVRKLPYNGAIVFDDVFYDDGKWLGKGTTAIDYLLRNGFSVVDQSAATLALRRREYLHAINVC
nr:hypothetical protein [uncultured Cohaesibacter sp.]